MTGYTVHTGSTEKFSTGWDRVFTGGRAKQSTTGRKPAKSKAAATKKRKKSAKS